MKQFWQDGGLYNSTKLEKLFMQFKFWVKYVVSFALHWAEPHFIRGFVNDGSMCIHTSICAYITINMWGLNCWTLLQKNWELLSWKILTKTTPIGLHTYTYFIISWALLTYLFHITHCVVCVRLSARNNVCAKYLRRLFVDTLLIIKITLLKCK